MLHTYEIVLITGASKLILTFSLCLPWTLLMSLDKEGSLVLLKTSVQTSLFFSLEFIYRHTKTKSSGPEMKIRFLTKFSCYSFSFRDYIMVSQSALLNFKSALHEQCATLSHPHELLVRCPEEIKRFSSWRSHLSLFLLLFLFHILITATNKWKNKNTQVTLKKTNHVAAVVDNTLP